MIFDDIWVSFVFLRTKDNSPESRQSLFTEEAIPPMESPTQTEVFVYLLVLFLLERERSSWKISQNSGSPMGLSLFLGGTDSKRAKDVSINSRVDRL